jgi:regulator of replication initiation timing
VPGPDSDELLLRLRRLPRQLLMALINGTAILVIVAAILAIVATSRVTHLAKNVAMTMTDAVLSRIDVEPQQVRARINNVGKDIHALNETLNQGAEGNFRQNPEIERLTERLGELQASIERLSDTRSVLVDEAMARIAREVAEGFEKVRACGKSPPGPVSR